MPTDITRFEQADTFTFFHTREWMAALLRHFPGWRDVSKVIGLPDGRQVWLPLLQTDRIGPWSWLESMPMAFFGGPVPDQGTLTRDDMAAVLQRIGPRPGLVSFNLDPCSPLANPDRLPAGAMPITTHILTLGSSYETTQSGFTKTMRYDMRRAEREGVTARRGRGAEDFRAYFELTRLAAHRWELSAPPFPLPLYLALASLPEDRVRLWLAEWDGQMIGGLINVFYAPGKVIHWASALNPAYAHLNPTKLLQHHAIQEACETGAEGYIMGPSVGFDGRPLPGVRVAKEALGARPHDYAVLIQMQPWAMRVRAIRERITRLMAR